MYRGRSTILFSATFLPIQYYKKLLGGEEQDYEVYAQSTFQEEKKKSPLANDVTSKYVRRSDEEYQRIARYIYEVVQQMIWQLYGVFSFPCISGRSIWLLYGILLQWGMYGMYSSGRIYERINERGFLKRFTGNEGCDLNTEIAFEIEEEEDKILIGFCVMGGIFRRESIWKTTALSGRWLSEPDCHRYAVRESCWKNILTNWGRTVLIMHTVILAWIRSCSPRGGVIRTAKDVGVVIPSGWAFYDISV